MVTLTLKNMPDDIYQRLKERAARNRRSLNQETIRCLGEVVGVPDESELRARLHAFHERVSERTAVASPEDIQAWIHEGRL